MKNDRFIDLLTDKHIQELISCPKRIEGSVPLKSKLVNGNPQIKFNLVQCDTSQNSARFSAFISSCIKRPEDFSIGLLFLYNGENYLLYRCNGFHGTTSSGFYSAEHHRYPHAHRLSEADIIRGNIHKPTTILPLTGTYWDERGAIAYFCETCGIINYKKYFSFEEQMSIFDHIGGS